MRPIPTRSAESAAMPPAVDMGRAAELQNTINLAPIGIAHFNADGRFTFANNFLCEILGYSREDLLSRTFQEITAPEDLPACLSATAQLAKGAVDRYQQQKRFVRGDGSVMWTRVTVSAVRETSHEIAYFVGIAEDISEERAREDTRRQSEAHLRMSEARFRTLANATDQMAWISDRDGRRSWYNDRWFEFTGMSFETLKDHGWHAVHDPAKLPEILADQRKAFAEDAVWEGMFSLRRHDGTIRWFLSRALPLTGADGRVEHWLGTNTDITDWMTSAGIPLSR
jgi:PAS domain S-box-containing protein